MAKSGKYGFPDTVADFAALTKQIEARVFVPTYLLMGDEPYFIDRLTRQLEEGVLSEAEKAFNQIVVYGRDSDAGSIVNLCRQMPMMGSYQMVVVREAQQLKKIEQLTIYTKSPSPSTILVLAHKEKSIDKRSALYKNIVDKGRVFESVRPRDYQLSGWLDGFVRGKGSAIEPKALKMLADHLGEDISKISNELDKLLIYLPQGTTMITPEHIESNIGISKDFNNFELTKALSFGDSGRAMLIADYFAHNPKDFALTVTVSALFTHFQRIFILNYQYWLARKRNVSAPSQVELSRLLRLPHPIFLDEYSQATARYPNKRVFEILGTIRQYDMKSKGMESGSASDGELLREMLLKIITAPNRR